MHTLYLGVLLLNLALAAFADPVDVSSKWIALTQQPFENLPSQDIGLRPLLLTSSGQPIKTAPEWEKQRQSLREAWLERLGAFPPKPAMLEVLLESAEVEGDHTRQLVSFLSEGDDRIRAYLLTPQGLKQGDKRPAIVVFHPTTKETLREPAGLGQRQEMALALHLVRRGYVTLSPECYIMKAGGPKSQAEQLAARRPGWTGLGKMTFDASRCVDYLETLPFVEASRIGCIGHSLGAKEVLFAMAFEPRFKAGVFNEGGIGLRMSNWTDPWYLTSAMKSHIPDMENHQMIAQIAPRPFLVMGGGDADGAASWPFVKEARAVYELLRARDRIGLYNHKGGHAFPEAARNLAYEWLDYWLDFKPPAIERKGR